VVFQLGLLIPPPNHFDSLTSGPIFRVHLTGNSSAEIFEAERNNLNAIIGDLTVKLEFLTKKSKQLGL
jgi:hypothetical protein